MNTEVIVIGAGAAGMMAAGIAARRGRSVLLLEKNALPGKKLRITGKGRCNLTNSCGAEEFLRNVPKNPKFLYSALGRFSPADTMAFFEELGVPLKVERGRRVFPVSDKAGDVAGALAGFCREQGVRTVQARAESIRREGALLPETDESLARSESPARSESLDCGAFTVEAGGRTFRSESVVLACGGMSYPATGSTGDGYRLAAALGHTVTPLRPSLVPLVSKDPACGEMQGLSLRNVEASLIDGRTGKVLYRELGELMFTHFGLSGPLVLSASTHIREMEPDRFRLRLDLKPGLDGAKLDARLLRDFSAFSNRDFANALEKLLPRKLIPVAVRRSGIPPDEKVNCVTREQRLRLLGILKGMEFSIDGFAPIETAVITSGGVCVKEVNPSTMESKRVKGLYFAGELLDVDAYTGGYNLQIAFSTGYAAGMSC